MEINKYIQQKKEIQNFLLNYIENENNDYESYRSLCQIVETQNIQSNNEDYEYFLFLICEISKNHHRNVNFFEKIEQIITYFKPSINQVFTNIELFNIFIKSKRILLFLLENKIIKIDENITNLILKEKGAEYFFTEIQPFLSDNTMKQNLLKIDSNIFSYFEKNRQIGENDSYVSQLIRNDSIEEFVIYVNRYNFSLSSKIKPSIFETNPFLLKKKEPTLIEYASFFGSIQIFQYLILNKVKLAPSLWLFAIHGKSAEIIHLLEEYRVKLDNSLTIECYKEAVKCHHNDIANYIEINYMNDKKYEYCYRYYNFSLFPNNINNDYFAFCCLCKYNYKTIVMNFIDKKVIKDFSNEANVLIYLF